MTSWVDLVVVADAKMRLHEPLETIEETTRKQDVLQPHHAVMYSCEKIWILSVGKENFEGL